MKFYSDKLPNGLTVVGEQRQSAESVAIGFFVRTGARDEQLRVSGVSHFLEHMVFKGTPSRSALDITYQLGAIGAQANAFTSEENTVYYMAVLPEYFDTAFELLADMMRPSLDAGEFETEKKVILEEIALYQDRPSFLLFEKAMRLHFGDHPAGNPVLGTVDSIADLRRDSMLEYFNHRYSPSNIVFAAAGNFDWQCIMENANANCGHWQGPVVMRDRPAFAPQQRSFSFNKENLQGAHVCITAKGPEAMSKDRHAAQVLSIILGDATGSRAYWELVDKGIAETAQIDNEEMDGVGLIYAYACSLPGEIERVENTLQSILSTPLEFTDDDLLRAKTKLRTRVVLQGESSMRRLMATGLNWIYRQQYLTLEEELEQIAVVSRGSIERLLDSYPLEQSISVKLLPS